MMTHTPTHPAEISSHAPEREREREREGEREKRVFFYVARTHTIPVHVSCSVCLFTEIPVLISIPSGSPHGGNAAGVVAPPNP